MIDRGAGLPNRPDAEQGTCTAIAQHQEVSRELAAPLPDLATYNC